MTERKRGISTSRRKVLKAGAAGLALTSAIGIAPKYLFPRARAAGLAPGMVGGPTGFEGAERYQYDEANAASRAVEAMKKLKAEGKAPDKIVMACLDGAVGHFINAHPVGAPTTLDLWEQETGVPVEVIGVSLGDAYVKMLQDVTTGAGQYDIYALLVNYYGDFYDAGGLVVLDDYVAKHHPDWRDPERGVSNDKVFDVLYKYDDKIVGLSFDGDFYTWFHRKDLFADPQHQKAFGDKYGYALHPPDTWDQADDVAQYFHSTGIDGHTQYMGKVWGISTWFKRFITMEKPNMYLFDLEGNPQIDSDIGIEVTEKHIQYGQYAGNGASYTWSWFESFGSMAGGTSAMMDSPPNVAKFTDLPPDESVSWLPTKVGGKIDVHLPIGRQFGDDLVRRSCLFGSATMGISTQSEYPEAAYLFGQWASSTTLYPWLCSNPAGYMDPFMTSTLEDPLVQDAYKKYVTDILPHTIPRAAPMLKLSGTGAMHQILDENLQQCFAGTKTPKEAMKDTGEAWRRIVRKKGETKMVDAIAADRKGWPTIIDKMPT
jgi:multiple sugar transport system substrate-binding protein